MKKILVNQAFQFSPDGNSVVTIEAGVQEVTERCAVVAIEHLKVAQPLDEGKQESAPKADEEKKDAKSGKGKAASKG